MFHVKHCFFEGKICFFLRFYAFKTSLQYLLTTKTVSAHQQYNVPTNLSPRKKYFFVNVSRETRLFDRFQRIKTHFEGVLCVFSVCFFHLPQCFTWNNRVPSPLACNSSLESFTSFPLCILAFIFEYFAFFCVCFTWNNDNYPFLFFYSFHRYIFVIPKKRQI